MARSAPPPSASEAVPGRAPWAGWAPLLVVGLAGAVVRIAAARGDLWLDEIWSAELARHAGSALGVFTRLHNDNNHHLTTLWLRLAGDEPSLLARGLALASGAVTLALLALAARRRGWWVALAATTLGSFSYLLVLYQSEARGYAPAVLCATAAYLALERWLPARRPGWALLFAAAGVAGVLSHLTFVFVLAGALAWAGLEAWRRRALDRGLLLAFGPPLAALAWLWAVDLRLLVRGGGPEDGTWSILRQLWRLTFNFPAGAAEWLGLAALALVGWQLVRLARQGDGRWVFFAATFAAALAPLLLRSRTDYLAARYFLVCVPFLLLLAAEALGALAAAGRAGRVAFAAALLLFVAGAAAPVARLLVDGRGRYREAIRYLVDRTPGDLVTVGTDHDYRNGAVLAFHAQRMALRKGLVLVTEGTGVQPPEWFLRHEFEPAPAAEPQMRGPGGLPYRLAAVFPSIEQSGWTWQVYRRAGDGGPP